MFRLRLQYQGANASGMAQVGQYQGANTVGMAQMGQFGEQQFGDPAAFGGGAGADFIL
jgi:hypothetical protein